MAGTNIAVPDALDKIVAYYDEQKHAMAAINHYVGTHCGLHNAMGFLLGYLQPLYDDSRDRMTTALDGLQSAVDGFSGQVVAYSRTWEELETNTATGIGVLDEELCVIGGGGNNGGSGGGGGYGGPPQVYQPPTAEPPVIEPPADETPIDETPVDEPAPDETPVEEPPVDDTPVDEIPVEETPTDEAPVDDPPADEPSIDIPVDETPRIDIDIDITVNNNTVVIEAGDGNIITTATGDNNTIVVDPAQALPHDAADQSRLEEFYERMWEERTAEDPLGRSAAELRAAWEAREPVPLEEALPGETTLGYSDAPRQGSTIRFEIFVPDSMLQPSGATR